MYKIETYGENGSMTVKIHNDIVNKNFGAS